MESTIIHSKRKRLFDIFFSLCALIILSPLFTIIALLIFVTSKSKKIIYAHERMGRGRTPFYCYKFCTMYPDADKRLKEILKNDPKLRNEWEEKHKLSKDPRVTPLGAFLRKTSLDELPQFWNVLKGDLSVVGPRPVVKDELIRHFGKKAEKILSVRPGITGIWQTSGRSATTYPRRIEMDERYIENHSLRLDVLIILRTFPAIFLSKDAY